MAERWPLPDVTVITGATGWLGRALLHDLMDPAGTHHRTGRLRLLIRDGEGADVIAASGNVDGDVDVLVGDVTAHADVHRLFAGTSGTVDVIHAAGLIHPRRVRDFYAVNATGTRALVAAARRAGVRRLVHVSSTSPFGANPHPGDVFRADEPYNPSLGYGISKMLAEMAVLENTVPGAEGDVALDAVVLRPPWFYGPFQPPRQTEFLRLVRRGRFPIVGRGDQRRSMVDVHALVDAIVAAELTPSARGKAYWIADARPYSIVEIVDAVRQALRAEGLSVSPRTLRLPAIAGRAARAADRALQRAGVYQQRLHVLGELGETIACDVSAARADLGVERRADLVDGMRASVRWCLEQGIAL